MTLAARCKAQNAPARHAFGGAPCGPAFRMRLGAPERILIVPGFGCDEHAYRASDWRIQRTVVKAQRPRPLIIGDSGPCSRSRSAKQDVALAGLDEHPAEAHHFAGGNLR